MWRTIWTGLGFFRIRRIDSRGRLGLQIIQQDWEGNDAPPFNVTPTNILRRQKDKVCLLGDLTLAKALEGTLAKQVTQPGQLIGDVPYMSPERTRDQAAVDWRSDIYGLGATCYALLTGRPPFESNALPELVRMVRDTDAKPPKEYQLAVNDLFQNLVLKMIAKRPEDRFDTPAELLRELDRIGQYNSLAAD